MLGFDQQMQFAAALTDSVAKASSMFGGVERKEPGRSWYRSPTPNPFDWTSWGVPAAAQPWGWPMPISQPIGAPVFGVLPFGQQPWSALASYASTMAALQSCHNAWAPLNTPSSNSDVISNAWQAMMWPLTQFNAIAAATTAPNPYSSYRSDSGHAVAQIVPAPIGRADTAINNSATMPVSMVH